MSKAPHSPFGKLMPDDEQAIEDIVAELRRQFALLGPNQWFEGRFGRDQHNRITDKTVAIKPPHIHPVRRA